MKLIGESLAIFGAEVCWAATDVAAAAELVENVSHRQPLADVRLGIKSAPRIDGFGALGHDVSRPASGVDDVDGRHGDRAVAQRTQPRVDRRTVGGRFGDDPDVDGAERVEHGGRPAVVVERE